MAARIAFVGILLISIFGDISTLTNSKTDQMRLECAREMKMPEAELDAGHEIPLEKCFQKCWLTKIGILTKEGKFDAAAFKKILGEMPAYQGPAAAKLDKCAATKEDEPCKFSFELVKCLIS